MLNTQIGKVIYLAGPSSSGKSTYAKEKEKEGWIHLEVDEEMFSLELGQMEAAFPSDMLNLKAHVKDPSRKRMYAILSGRITLTFPIEETRQRLSHVWKSRVFDVIRLWKKAFTNILIQADQIAQNGKNVIIDFVPFLNEHPTTTIDGLFICEKGKVDTWKFREIKIEQKLKYVPVDRLMQNILERNQDPVNYRTPSKVLVQYADQFKVLRKEEKSLVGRLKVEYMEVFLRFAFSQAEYAQKREEIFKRMKIPAEAVEVPLTYRSKFKTNVAIV